MSNQLIPVFNGTMLTEAVLLVNARDLHEFLGVRRDFSTWIKNRITEYGFLIDTDYLTVQNLRSPNSGSTKSRAQMVTDYHITLDTAKELAMVERNENGRQVRRYFIECEKELMKNAAQPSKPTSEPLSNHDMQNLKRLVWLMTGSMKFEQAWTQGVWYSLRAATGTPSPKPFTVDDLPVLGEECRRIMKITTAVKHAMYEFEKDVIRKVVRKRGDLTPVIEQMTMKLTELQNMESDGLLMLETFDSVNIDNMVARR